MSKLTVVIDNLGHNKLRNYLMTPNIIKMEIILYLDIFKTPSILSFNKYPKFKTFNYAIIIDDIYYE